MLWSASLMVLIGLHAAAGPDAADAVRIPINNAGDVDVAEVVARLAARTGLDVKRPAGTLRLPVTGLGGALTRRLLADSLGPDVAVIVRDDHLVVALPAGGIDPRRRPQFRAGLEDLAARARKESQRRLNYGMHALKSYRPNDPRRPTVCLVHGLNSSSDVFVHLIGPLEEAGYGVVVYDYPDNRDLDDSAPIFARDWSAFRQQVGETRPWAIVAHSMGGLLARSYVEGDGYGHDVAALILIAPPNQGSGLAQAQTLVQLAKGLHALNGRTPDALAHLSDGLGEAADDMLPASTFLTALNRRERRAGVAYHILAGDSGVLSPAARKQVEVEFRALTSGRGVFGGLTRLAVGDLSARLDEMTDGLGDGCVAVSATRLDGVGDPTTIHANHLELIRAPLLYPDPGPVACLPQVLRWLDSAFPPGHHRP